MTALKVRADYEALARIAVEFMRQAVAARRMLLQLRLQKSILQNGHWVGKGADKFYTEMDSSLLPAVQRLALALETASRVTGRIIQVMRAAEIEAATVLRDLAVGNIHVAASVVQEVIGASTSAVVDGLQELPGLVEIGGKVRARVKARARVRARLRAGKARVKARVKVVKARVKVVKARLRAGRARVKARVKVQR